jgi:1-deoxy-D-xylulose-5-phosphate reductoisomerase
VSLSRLSILGATGSIGRSTLDVILAHRDAFEVEAVAGGRDARALAATAKRLGARFAALADEGGHALLRDELAGTGIASGAGATAVIEAAQRDADLVVAAISGTAGLPSAHAALAPGRRVALANKESLVCAGEAFMRDAKRIGAAILPMDSEHNALAQALGGGAIDDVATMTITASGGPFRTWPAERIATATPDEASAHPTWSMGRKINIDSATLMNKGLELIEAHHLFGLDADRLEVVVHPQSIVHGLVHWRDGAVTAGLAQPDMRVPIAHCLKNGARLPSTRPRLDLAAIGSLTFEAPDLERFPCLRLAMTALARGGALPAVLNAANEVAVEAFLAGKIGFGGIAALVERVCARSETRWHRAPDTVEEALTIDADSRQVAVSFLSAIH